MGKMDKDTENSKSIKYDIAAYVWPSCHDDKRFGNMLWPEGKGEWEIIQKGNPRFEGHYQPKLPLYGYELDNNPKVMEKWIDLALKHHINVFVFDWYWFDEGPFLESSLNDGFLQANNNESMQFYLMWANHDVKRNYWNVHQFKNDDSLLWDGAVDRENFERIVHRTITDYFKRPNYYKIDGRPVFSIFSLKNLEEGLGGIQEAAMAIDYFREETIKAGFPGLHLQLIANGGPNEFFLGKADILKANSITKYNWGGPHPEDYLNWGARNLKERAEWKKSTSISYFPNVSIGWDDTPRFPAKGVESVVHYNNSPTSFASFLHRAKVHFDQYPEDHKLITVFSWNEWVEGGYLLPDMANGFGYLEAVKKVMENELFNEFDNTNEE
jgi:hypothetical protein